jgi:hypothetical protein
VLAVLYFGAFAVPAAVEAVYVGPNQITLDITTCVFDFSVHTAKHFSTSPWP